eukprot:scaffold295719_cov49-Prasinocladus_malaysianus.AAC.3
MADALELACRILASSGSSLTGCESYGAGLQRLLTAVVGQTGGQEGSNKAAWALRAVLAMSEADAKAR